MSSRREEGSELKPRTTMEAWACFREATAVTRRQREESGRRMALRIIVAGGGGRLSGGFGGGASGGGLDRGFRVCVGYSEFEVVVLVTRVPIARLIKFMIWIL